MPVSIMESGIPSGRFISAKRISRRVMNSSSGSASSSPNTSPSGHTFE